MITKDCFMASVDLRHGYYSVLVNSQFRKYLRFVWNDKLYQYTCFPNGLSNCPRYFTKLMKPVYSALRSQGYMSAAFIDDSYLQGQTFKECAENVQETVELFESLGFVIHAEKSVLTPCRKVKYLGFWLDSEKMTVTLPVEKVQKISNSCKDLRQKKKVQIRDLARVIGLLVSSFPAVTWGPLNYRHLERNKAEALKENKGNFDAWTHLTCEAEFELTWWIENIATASFSLETTDSQAEINRCLGARLGSCLSVKTNRW